MCMLTHNAGMYLIVHVILTPLILQGQYSLLQLGSCMVASGYIANQLSTGKSKWEVALNGVTLGWAI